MKHANTESDTTTQSTATKKAKLAVEALTSPSRENAALALSSLCFDVYTNKASTSTSTSSSSTASDTHNNPQLLTLSQQSDSVTTITTTATAATSSSSVASNLMSTMMSANEVEDNPHPAEDDLDASNNDENNVPNSSTPTPPVVVGANNEAPTTNKRKKNASSGNSDSSAAQQASRKDKSLGGLCENFIAKYDAALRRMKLQNKNLKQNQNSIRIAEIDFSKHDLISIDAAAAVLGVERRRIYDIINILESLEMVRRKCKNTYVYQGSAKLPTVLAQLQASAILIFEQDALRNGLVTPAELHQLQIAEKQKAATVSKEKSLGKLSQRFIQYFLVGNTNVSLTQAASRVLGTTAGLKTKIRRLYDIANVMVSIGVLKKAMVCAEGSSSSSSSAQNGVNRPVFAWSGVCVRQLRCSFVASSASSSPLVLQNHHLNLNLNLASSSPPSSSCNSKNHSAGDSSSSSSSSLKQQMIKNATNGGGSSSSSSSLSRSGASFLVSPESGNHNASNNHHNANHHHNAAPGGMSHPTTMHHATAPTYPHSHHHVHPYEYSHSHPYSSHHNAGGGTNHSHNHPYPGAPPHHHHHHPYPPPHAAHHHPSSYAAAPYGPTHHGYGPNSNTNTTTTASATATATAVPSISGSSNNYNSTPVAPSSSANHSGTTSAPEVTPLALAMTSKGSKVAEL